MEEKVSGTISPCVHSLQHSSDGEAWRKTGGEVFEGVDHQVDPGGQTRNSHTGPLFSCERTSEALKSKRAFKEERLNSKMKARDRERGESQPVEQRATHSFLSRAFSSSFVNKLFSPICIQNKQWDISDTFIFTSSRLLYYLISVRNAALPLIKLCPGFYPQWLTWQLE